MKKILMFAVVALLCVGTGAFAMSVNWSGTACTASITLADQTSAVGEGSYVGLGIFGTMTDSQIIALGANPTAIINAFTAWETATVDNQGLYSGSGNAINGTGFFTSRGYVVALNAAVASDATQVGVFKGPSVGDGFGDAWIFPAADGNASPPSFVLDSVGSIGILIGTFGSQTYAAAWAQDTDTPGTEHVDAYALIPEPSTYMLVGTGLLGLLALRRRRS